MSPETITLNLTECTTPPTDQTATQRRRRNSKTSPRKEVASRLAQIESRLIELTEKLEDCQEDNASLRETLRLERQLSPRNYQDEARINFLSEQNARLMMLALATSPRGDEV